VPDTDKDPRVRVGVRELRGNLSGFLRQARLGASFLVVSHNEVVAEIHPPAAPSRRPRVPGALRGQIWLAEDSERTPDDLIDAMEGKDAE
jgi:antitoxin (DNA-binding transcriptional repressor) of toxin-antitoxin stability system